MSTELDLKGLWNKGATSDIPDSKELIKKAAGLRKIFRFKLILQTVTLIATIIVMLLAGLSIDHRMWTTTVGLVLMIIGIGAYLITTNQLLPMLFKSNADESSQEYLNQLIRIQRKNEFMRRVMIDVYFCFLTMGLWLYLLQAANKITAVYAVLLYVVPSAAMAIAWVCSKRWEFRKMSGLGETIKKLELVNQQLLDNRAE